MYEHTMSSVKIFYCCFVRDTFRTLFKVRPHSPFLEVGQLLDIAIGLMRVVILDVVSCAVVCLVSFLEPFEPDE